MSLGNSHVAPIIREIRRGFVSSINCPAHHRASPTWRYVAPQPTDPVDVTRTSAARSDLAVVRAAGRHSQAALALAGIADSAR